MITLRLAEDDDVDRIVALHVASWRVTYRGMYSDHYLDEIVEGERQRQWRERWRDRSASWTLLAEDGPELVGFVHVELDDDPVWGPLVENLHAAPSRKRQGIGRVLLGEAAAFVARVRPGDPMHLWVLDANTGARAFYAAVGGEDVETSPWLAPAATRSSATASSGAIRPGSERDRQAAARATAGLLPTPRRCGEPWSTASPKANTLPSRVWIQ